MTIPLLIGGILVTTEKYKWLKSQTSKKVSGYSSIFSKKIFFGVRTQMIESLASPPWVSSATAWLGISTPRNFSMSHNFHLRKKLLKKWKTKIKQQTIIQNPALMGRLTMGIPAAAATKIFQKGPHFSTLILAEFFYMMTSCPMSN